MYTGPNIVRDGLVLHLDAANEKSFRGEPTTNVVANSQPTVSWGVSNFGGSTATVSYLTENGVPFLRYTSVTSVSGYPRFTDSIFPNSATITGTFSTSFEARGTPDAQLGLRIYENGSTKITNVATLTSDWVRYKFENQSTAFNLNQPYFHAYTTGATYDIRNIQIEAKPYATPFVNGTRGTTVATGGGWADRSGNNNHGTLVNGPTYSSDGLGGVVFDGVDDSHTVNMSSIPNFSAITFNCWYKSNINASTCLLTSTPIILHFRGAGFYLRDTSSGNSGYLAWNSSPVAFRWNMLTGTWDGSVMKLYQNGVKQVTERGYTGGAAGLLSNNGTWTIGGYFNSTQPWSSGSLSNVQVYNRALTAEEILQMYEATKSRFGL